MIPEKLQAIPFRINRLTIIVCRKISKHLLVTSNCLAGIITRARFSLLVHKHTNTHTHTSAKGNPTEN